MSCAPEFLFHAFSVVSEIYAIVQAHQWTCAPRMARSRIDCWRYEATQGFLNEAQMNACNLHAEVEIILTGYQTHWAIYVSNSRGRQRLDVNLRTIGGWASSGLRRKIIINCSHREVKANVSHRWDISFWIFCSRGLRRIVEKCCVNRLFENEMQIECSWIQNSISLHVSSGRRFEHVRSAEKVGG